MAKTLTAEQYIAIKWLALPKKGGKSFEQVAKEAGVHRNTLEKWRKDPLFEKELKQEIIRQTQDRLPELMKSMMDGAIEDKNAAMVKLALQVNDMLKDRVEVSTDNQDGQSLDDIKAKIRQYKTNCTP